MKEDFLHYLWKFKKFEFSNVLTTTGETIEILNVGQHNNLAGPDFFNARLNINGQIWAGNVEIHLKSSDWYAHNHEQDNNYDNVILHVVWDDDVDVYGVGNRALLTLNLKDYVQPELLNSYKKLFDRQKNQFINCENDFKNVENYLLENWLERLYFERLERKVSEIEVLLKESSNDWEAVLFCMLARNFGTKVNGASFTEMAKRIPFSVIRKVSRSGKLEPLFLGFANILPQENLDKQSADWKKDYDFLKAKFNLQSGLDQSIQFFKLRPDNFPTIRLSQLARLYEQEDQLFHKLISFTTTKEFYNLLSVQASQYWETHYNFSKAHDKRVKKISKSFIDLVVINTIIPIKFAYAKYKDLDIEDELIELITSLKSEKNTITGHFYKLRPIRQNALNSQALIQLKNEYCDKNLCLKCAVGSFLISNPDAIKG
tara:strand:- start:632 stop:1921 length:1290 start_codon:yes stop_codon:yes gene_type:complete